jgi:protein ImuB
VAATAARIAFILAPQLAVQSLERADPELVGAPLVVCEGREVLELSPAAHALGLRPGMTIFAARAAAPEAQFRARSPELVRSAEAALVDLAASFSPRVEVSPRLDTSSAPRSALCGPRSPTAAGVALDVSELGRLFASEAQLANALFVGARKVGLAVRVGLAGDKTTARIAALAGEVTVVAAGREAPFLSSLPLELLEPAPETLALLRRWGVRTIGELEALPAGGVAVRLGAEGARLSRIARGQACDRLDARPAPLVFEEGIDFDWPVENNKPLLFVLRRLLENLTARLDCRALASGDLGLTMKLAPRGRDVRTIPVAVPTRDVGTLVGLVKLALETSPPGAAVDGVIVRTAPARPRPAQLGFFEAASPSLVERHLPDAVIMQPSDSPRLRAVCAPAAREADTRQLALHALRPPLDAEARLDRGELRYLAGQGIAGQVLAAAGPFRVRDGWWQRPLLRDYYDVQLSDGAIYRVFHDLNTSSWHIDGCYE